MKLSDKCTKICIASQKYKKHKNVFQKQKLNCNFKVYKSKATFSFIVLG